MICIDVPEGKQVTIKGPGQFWLKTQTPDQVEASDVEVIPEQVIPKEKK